MCGHVDIHIHEHEDSYKHKSTNNNEQMDIYSHLRLFISTYAIQQDISQSIEMEFMDRWILPMSFDIIGNFEIIKGGSKEDILSM